MRDDAEQIRALFEGWAQAVHQDRIDTVVADHAEDVVMFDVPPPYRGVRGTDAYRKVWPTFDIEEPEAAPSADIALALELVRCST
ncbi:nuclear transport factor 2 family protein [Streptomyces parvus]|uniref:YybH family protein n=1 Tax=Streptomyces parvus TaxID=66428 RepID=UPI00342C8710